MDLLTFPRQDVGNIQPVANCMVAKWPRKPELQTKVATQAWQALSLNLLGAGP